MAWQTVQFVSTGLMLVAFISAGIVSLLLVRLKERQKLIAAADRRDRPRLIADSLELVHLDPKDLPPDRQWEFFREILRQRIERFRIIAVLVLVFGLSFAGLTAYAISEVRIDACSSLPFDERPIECLKERK